MPNLLLERIAVSYPYGPPEDPKRNRDKPKNYTEGTELWPYIAERVKHIHGRAPIVWLLCDICQLLELGHPAGAWVLITDLGKSSRASGGTRSRSPSFPRHS